MLNRSNIDTWPIINLLNKQIDKLPAEIGEAINIKWLVLQKNNIEELPREIAKLSNLEALLLGKNKLQVFPTSILNLLLLRQLDLSDNAISELPTNINQLSHILYLNLASNKMSFLPEEFFDLSSLKWINLSNNKITNLSGKIEKLNQLEVLNISRNKISHLPTEIGKLINLEKLLVSSNSITSLPLELLSLPNLRYLDLQGNPLPIPPEILKKTNEPKSILNYYFSVIQNQKRPINEIKLIVVGQGSVGKTSLIERMMRNTFNPQQNKTEGISISQWSVPDEQQTIASGIASIKLNLWDFGGQEIMHATHQFFLTKRSLYLLVLDARLTQEENRVEYWLKIILSFGGGSPVLIVGNKADQHPLDIDRSGLQKKYPNIIGILETSAATGIGIDALKAAIAEQASSIPHVRDLLPDTWFTVKAKLEELGHKKNYITHEDYGKLCAKNDVHDEISQHTLIGFLHDLGMVLYFQDEPRLESLGILNPQWVTNGVYRILNSHELFQDHGVLTITTLGNILNMPEYPRGKRLYIVDMMKKFELCYDIDADKTFLVPDLLPKEQPLLNFSGTPVFQYQYPVLPSSVMTRFIVRMNQYIYNNLVWRSGVLLKIGENLALVKADAEDKTISITVDGLEHTRRDALAAIRYHLDEIHSSIKGLNPQKRVPIPGAPDAESQEYEFLLMLEREGKNIFYIKDGKRLLMVDVHQLLSGIEGEIKSKDAVGNITNIYVGGNVDGNIVSGDQNNLN